MRTELRLALAMRGGVSLAVWIGGAVSEIDLIRRAEPDDAGHDDFWSQLLREATGYRRVVVDVLAGASAGGLNGVLYAASQVYDFRYHRMRDIWLDVGGTEGLVRRKDPWPSLFKGDEYFLDQVHQKLAESIADGSPEEPAAPRLRLELALSTTLMEPIVRSLPGPPDEPPLCERRYAGGFRFRQPEEPWLPTDFPVRGAPGFDELLWRLALAARSTSSYPGAFEAAAVRSSRRETFKSQPLATGAGPGVDLDGTFLDRTSDALPFVVADGGILDNIPIGRALDSVARAPAGEPTERCLIYLQPGASTRPKPPDPSGAPKPDDPLVRRATVSVLRGVAGARVGGETINADIAAIEAYNEAIERATLLRHATFDGLSDRGSFMNMGPPDDEARQMSAYRITRSSYEARQVFALLLDPLAVMGEDQFPEKAAGRVVTDDCWRSPIAAWSHQLRVGLETKLSEEVDRLLHDPPHEADLLTCTGDPAPLLRVTDLLIEWARWIEKTPAAPTATRPLPDAGAVKRSLYRVRAFLEAILQRTRRFAWVSAAARIGDGRETFVAQAVPAMRDLTMVTRQAADATIGALRDGGTEPLEKVCGLAIARIDEVVTAAVGGLDEGTEPPRDVDLLSSIAQLLVEMVGPLTGACPLPTNGKCEPGELLHRVLRGAPVSPEVLRVLEVRCIGEFVSGLPGRRPIDFWRLSSANRTPLAPRFTRLLDEAACLGLWWDPPQGAQGPAPKEEQRGIHVTLKLAGNELANFSAFLLATWRANDWLWGRLDAVPTMIDLLVRPKSLAPRLAVCADDKEALEKVHQLVAPSRHPWRNSLDAEVWRPSRAQIKTEVGALRRAGDQPDAVGIGAIRSALIARRQWEILGQEIVLRTESMGSPPAETANRAPTLEDVKEWVAGYWVGAETLRSEDTAVEPKDEPTEPAEKAPQCTSRPPDKTPELLDRFGELAKAATETILWNAAHSPLSFKPPPLVERAVRLAGPVLGRQLAERAIGGRPRSKRGWKTAAAVVGLATLLVAGVLGWFMDKGAFVLGVVVAFAPLAGLVWWLYQWVRRALGRTDSQRKRDRTTLDLFAGVVVVLIVLGLVVAFMDRWLVRLVTGLLALAALSALYWRIRRVLASDGEGDPDSGTPFTGEPLSTPGGSQGGAGRDL